MFIALCFLFIGTTSAKAWFGQKKKTDLDKAVEQKQIKTEPVASTPQKAVVNNEVKEEVKKVPEQPQAPQVDQKALKAKRALIEEKRRKLNNTEWKIELRALGGAAADKNKEKKEVDIVTFKDNQVIIEDFSKKGFPMTNYTLSVQEDGTCIWETMQTSEKSGLAFWRGELNPAMEIMQGILSHHIDDKTTKDFSFVSISKGVVVSEGK